MGGSERDIIKIGFVEMGQWFLSKTCKSGIDYHIRDSEEKLLIYAFTSADMLRYIGKSTITLKGRMDEYKGITEKHEKRLADLIKGELGNGKVVKIFILPFNPSDSNVSLSEKEGSLIKKFDPPWNKQGRPVSIAGVTAGNKL